MSLKNRTKYTLIGAVILLSLFILIWGLNYLKGKKFFTADHTYYTSYQEIGGLSESSPVNINGFKIGQVSAIKLNMQKRGLVEVEFSIKPDYKIPKGTIAYLVSTDLMGTKAIELQLSHSDEYLSPYDTLQSGTEGSLKDQVSMQMLPLKHKVEDLLIELERSIGVIQKIFNEQSQNNIQSALAALSKSSINLAQMTDTLSGILFRQRSNLEQTIGNIRSITENLKANNKNIDKIIANLRRLTDSLSSQSYTQTLSALNRTMTNIDQTLQDLRVGKGTIGQLVVNDTLYLNLVKIIDQTHQLLIDFEDNPRKYLNFSIFDFSKHN